MSFRSAIRYRAEQFVKNLPFQAPRNPNLTRYTRDDMIQAYYSGYMRALREFNIHPPETDNETKNTGHTS